MIWTDERKQKVLDHLAAVNLAMAKANGAVRHRKPAEAGEHILDAVAEKHRAIDEFPPITVNATETMAPRDYHRRSQDAYL
jgi:hypothetical protein